MYKFLKVFAPMLLIFMVADIYASVPYLKLQAPLEYSYELDDSKLYITENREWGIIDDNVNVLFDGVLEDYSHADESFKRFKNNHMLHFAYLNDELTVDIYGVDPANNKFEKIHNLKINDQINSLKIRPYFVYGNTIYFYAIKSKNYLSEITVFHRYDLSLNKWLDNGIELKGLPANFFTAEKRIATGTHADPMNDYDNKKFDEEYCFYDLDLKPISCAQAAITYMPIWNYDVPVEKHWGYAFSPVKFLKISKAKNANFTGLLRMDKKLSFYNTLNGQLTNEITLPLDVQQFDISDSGKLIFIEHQKPNSWNPDDSGNIMRIHDVYTYDGTNIDFAMNLFTDEGLDREYNFYSSADDKTIHTCSVNGTMGTYYVYSIKYALDLNKNSFERQTIRQIGDGLGSVPYRNPNYPTTNNKCENWTP